MPTFTGCWVIRSCSAFCNAVPNVIQLCTKEQVTETNARWIVTSVQHLQRGPFSSVQEPRNNAGYFVFPFAINANIKHSIATLFSPSCPLPASVTEEHLVPEPLEQVLLNLNFIQRLWCHYAVSSSGAKNAVPPTVMRSTCDI